MKLEESEEAKVAWNRNTWLELREHTVTCIKKQQQLMSAQYMQCVLLFLVHHEKLLNFIGSAVISLPRLQTARGIGSGTTTEVVNPEDPECSQPWPCTTGNPFNGSY